MAKGKGPPSDIREAEDWLDTYADAITLLMAFFVMILHFKDYDAGQQEQAAEAIRNSMGVASEAPTQSTLFELLNEVGSVVEGAEIPKDDYSVEFDQFGVIMEFWGGSFFKAGSATLTKKAVKIISDIGTELKSEENKHFKVEVEGHTDDVPIKTKQFPSNWVLSAARAAAVVSKLIDNEFKATRLKASGYAHTRPKVPNLDMFNEPIPENRKLNRRITIRLMK